MSDILFDKLNDKQIESVKATEGRVRVVAGAGSGKTRVLAHRYAYLVERLGIDPGNILCMTFTNKAAQEMRNRIAKMVHAHNVNDFVCTIHGFCVKFLRQEIHRIGYPKNFVIIDEEDSKILAKQVIEELKLERSKETVRKLLNNVLEFKSINPYIEILLLPSCNIAEQDLLNPVIRYICLQKKYYSLDFYDLTKFTLYVLRSFEEAKDFWQKKLNYIMVDEAQDCNRDDWALINILSGYYNNLFIVGDPDQAIYEWRGAKPHCFVNFHSDKDVILNENYRSTPDILNVANSIITNNKERIEKELFTKNGPGKVALHFHGKSEPQEADWIASQIDKLLKNGVDNSDIAVLYRSSFLSRNIEEALIKKQIKYTVWGGIRFFERKEIKDCLAYLRLAVYHDDISFKRVINMPSRKFGKTSLSNLTKLAENEGLSLYETLERHIEDNTFNKEPLKQFLQTISSAKSMTSSTGIVDVMDFLLEDSGLKEVYRLDDDEERLENITELVNSMKKYEEDNREEEYTLETYLQDIALFTNADYKKEGTTVKLMTIHQSKGLEFPYIIICGLSEGIFPNHRTIRERKKSGLEEERRLMYVAITRAEKAVFLTESEGFNFQSKSQKFPSRFLLEIKKGLTEVEGDIDPELFNQTNNVVIDLDDEIEGKKIIKVGDRIKHSILGDGEIIEIHEKFNTCLVKFGDSARTLSQSFISRLKYEIKDGVKTYFVEEK